LCLKDPAVYKVFVGGKYVAIIVFLLTEKLLKGFSYKLIEISGQNQLWARTKQDQFATKMMFRNEIFMHLPLWM